MEALHVAVEDAIKVGLYRGVQVRSLYISHLLFVDDILFLGEWSRSNIIGLVSLLQCFHDVSGLKINLHKSNLYGIGVNTHEISNLASFTGCTPQRLPFTYLGIPIGSNMSRIKEWNPIIDKLKKRLSKWKQTCFLWMVGSNIFMVRDTQIYINLISLLDFPIETRWCRFIPRKVNILVWRALRDLTPTRWNLSRKGIEVPSLLYPLCNISPETSAHLFWSCLMVTLISRLVFKWIDLTFPYANNLNDVFNWLDDTHLNSASKI
ncbi:RNA-directed DNA polymerase, eukaryota, partial [Tanacetum coccineum]